VVIYEAGSRTWLMQVLNEIFPFTSIISRTLFSAYSWSSSATAPICKKKQFANIYYCERLVNRIGAYCNFSGIVWVYGWASSSSPGEDLGPKSWGVDLVKVNQGSESTSEVIKLFRAGDA
jgi:hypothetical protein